MNGRELVAEILAGRELVVISPDESANSAVFHATRSGKIRVFAVAFGDIDHPEPSKLAAHFDKLQKEGCALHLRGARRADA